MTFKPILSSSPSTTGVTITNNVILTQEVVFLLPLGETLLPVTSDMLVDTQDAGINDPEALYFVYLNDAYIPIYDEATLIFPDTMTAELSNTTTPAPAVYLFDGFGKDDLLTGTPETDDVFNFLASDHMYGGAGHDTIKARSGNDSLFGEQGRDLLKAGAGADDVHGGTGMDTLIGAKGADTLRGNAGADVLDGGRGADRLFGGLRNDYLDGGLGNDTLTGGAGMDIFYFSSGHDVIADFDPTVDRLMYRDKSISGAAAFSASGKQIDDDVVYALADDPDNSLTLLDTDLESVRWQYITD